MTTNERVSGRSVPRLDAYEKVTGSAKYCVDLTMPGTLHAAVVRSERAHARLVAIDRSAANAHPGVVAVVTSDDLDGLFPRFGHIIADHPILAIDKVRYWGEPVALVVAETKDQAVDAVAHVRVEYEDLPSVLDARSALDPDAPVLHDEPYEGGEASFKTLSGGGGGGQRHPNVAHEAVLEWGDVDGAFERAHLVVENTADYPMLYAYAMEPYNAVASYSDGELIVQSTAQHPYQVREDLARVFGLPLSRVQVSSPYLGGGYGSKSYTKVEPLAAVGSWVTGRPVKVVLTVEESIYTTRVDSAHVRVRSAFAADGRILAREFDITLDSGAYADNSPLVLGKSVNRCFGPYRVPALRVHGRSIYTNTSPASSYRGFGTPQGNLAGETNIDRAAEQLGLDPLEIRKTNLVDKGEELLPGKRPLDAEIAADMDMVTSALTQGLTTIDAPLVGTGFGCAASDAGAFPISTATVRILPDGSVQVLTGSTEMGQGSRTVLGQIAAQELGVSLDRISVIQSDTARTPYERTTGASRTTTLTGLALVRACADARARVREMAAEAAGVSTTDVIDTPDGVAFTYGESWSYSDVIEQWFGSRAGEVTGIGLVRKGDDTAQMPPFWEIGAVGVTVSVDPDTGAVTVEHLATVGDVGFAINPMAVEGQDLGAATQGLGAALYEELIYDGPHPVNPNVVDYRVPRIADMAKRIDTMLAERGDGIGPYGAKGAGEGALNPIGGAVASAVARAIGRWPSQLPLTPERVWLLLQEAQESQPAG
jgi:CO/xanthine dehydrogenase Mo-binding subunit